MSDHNPKVEPIRFDAVGTSAPATPEQESGTHHDAGKTASEHPAGPPSWALPALGVLLVLALLVFFWLPSTVEPPSVEVEVGSQPPKPRPGMAEISPWQEAQQGKLRKQAQDVLTELLDIQFSLEETGAEQWAGEALAHAKAIAEEGDSLYRQQQFVEATQTYQSALDALEAISGSSEQLFEEKLAAARQAMENDEANAAISALQTALLIQPAHAGAEKLLVRAQNLEQVLDLLDQAEAFKAAGELEQAQTLLQQAADLDPEHLRVQAELAQLGRDIARNRFNAAMTRGYTALDQGRYDTAESAFREARKLMPSSAETESALQETRAARTRARILSLRNSAEQAAGQEQWQSALETYQKILDIDASMVFARVGLIQSRERASIDKRLEKYISEPQRLGDAAIYQSARRIYADAAALEVQGPRLEGQVRKLGEILRFAQTPVEVVLQSDEVTRVTVYKVAQLGTFVEHRLELKPGTYTAVGVRPGYRDVRQTFSVSHGKAPAPIRIVCTEQI